MYTIIYFELVVLFLCDRGKIEAGEGIFFFFGGQGILFQHFRILVQWYVVTSLRCLIILIVYVCMITTLCKLGVNCYDCQSFSSSADQGK